MKYDCHGKDSASTPYSHFLKEMTLKELEQRLEPEFVRCHGSWIVRWNSVRKIENLSPESWMAVLAGGLKAKVSAEGRTDLKRVLEG